MGEETNAQSPRKTSLGHLRAVKQLKSLSPLFVSVFGEKLSHLWIQIKKKQLNFLRLSMGFDRKKLKI